MANNELDNVTLRDLFDLDFLQEFQDTFDVIVIQETTPVLYDSNGRAYADWERQADTTTDIGSAN